MALFDLAVSGLPSELSYPVRQLLVEKAGQELGSAIRQYRQALRKFTDFVEGQQDA